ncbi:hypothetical protein ECO111_0803 [Escherichia coli O111:H- str. 11128]|nr:hypothetical protein ECO111_0803 [Escherichia coli O111:H- str. 11128]
MPYLHKRPINKRRHWICTSPPRTIWISFNWLLLHFAFCINNRLPLTLNNTQMSLFHHMPCCLSDSVIWYSGDQC